MDSRAESRERNDLAEAARSYLSSGWRVVPSRGGKPCLEGWERRVAENPLKPSEAEAAWDGADGILLACGEASDACAFRFSPLRDRSGSGIPLEEEGVPMELASCHLGITPWYAMPDGSRVFFTRYRRNFEKLTVMNAQVKVYGAGRLVPLPPGGGLAWDPFCPATPENIANLRACPRHPDLAFPRASVPMEARGRRVTMTETVSWLIELGMPDLRSSWKHVEDFYSFPTRRGPRVQGRTLRTLFRSCAVRIYAEQRP